MCKNLKRSECDRHYSAKNSFEINKKNCVLTSKFPTTGVDKKWKLQNVCYWLENLYVSLVR